jgi:phosphatidylglycerophosphatase C
MTATTIAAFDFDATLTKRDSVVPFLRAVAGTRRLIGGLLVRPHQVVPAAARGSRDSLRAIASEAALGGVTRVDFERHASELAARIIDGGLRDDTAGRLGWHRQQGHRVVIVSASYEQYVRLVGDHLGVDEVLATRVEFDRADRCTGRLVGRNCRAEEKVRRLSEWLRSIDLVRDDATIWAYGDSNGDRAMLEFADYPVWVNRPLGSVAPTD